MEYPVKEENIINKCRKYFASKGLEFSRNDEEYIHIFTKVLNHAHAAGLQDALRGKKSK